MLSFPVDMDQTVEPVGADFVLLVDGVPKTPVVQGWDTATLLELSYQEALLAPAVVRCQYPDMLPNFRSLQLQPVFPFDLLLVAV